jgi:hypothetical protein
MRELNVSGGIFIWSNNHTSPTLEKLDIILMSRECELFFPTICGHNEPKGLSDHNPLIISAPQLHGGSRRDFRFELFWVKHPEFLSKVAEIWNAPTRDVVILDKILFKLKKVNFVLKGWGFNLSGSRKKRKKEIQDGIADLEAEESGP